MATQTTNYNLPVVEGSDTVNLLTVLPDLATKVDAQMKINANTGIQRGTHSKSGTVNAVTVPTDLATGTFFTFVASDDFTEGDSFTFNGEVIAARTPEGKALKTGAFSINQNVLCCNYNGILTIYTNQSASAVDLALDDSSNNPIANSAVAIAINSIKSDLGNADISSVGNNVKNAIINLDGDITVINNAVTGLDGKVTQTNENLKAADNLIFRFASDGEGNHGYLGADGSFIPFKSGASASLFSTGYIASLGTRSIAIDPDKTYIIVAGLNFNSSAYLQNVFIANKNEVIALTATSYSDVTKIGSDLQIKNKSSSALSYSVLEF